MDVFYHALIEMMNLRDGERLTQLWRRWGRVSRRSISLKAIAAFHNTLERFRQQEDIVRDAQGLRRVVRPRRCSARMRSSATNWWSGVSLLKKVDDLEWQAALYQSIAFAYTHRGESRRLSLWTDSVCLLAKAE
jgi:hypothetical protein